MTSHFTSIGFSLDSNEDFAAVLARVPKEGESISAEGGHYIRWPIDGPSQLWIQVNQSNSLVGMNPHFVGQATMRIRIGRRLARNADNPLEGGLHGLANPAPDGEGGDYPFVFDVPDFALTTTLALPIVAEVQIAAFAHRCIAHPSEEAFRATQTSGVRYGAKSFIPTGLFGVRDDPNTHPPARARFNGIVRETALLTNLETGLEFRWAWVSTAGGEIDVVATPDEIVGEVVVGGVVEVSGWLSGRIITTH